MKFYMEKILVDTNVFVSFYWENDPNHKTADKIFTKYSSQNSIFYINNYLISEILTVLLFKTKAVEKVVKLGENFYFAKSNVKVVQAPISWQKKALKIFSQQVKSSLSFPDCILIYQTIAQKIKTIFTFDKNIRKISILKDCRFLP